MIVLNLNLTNNNYSLFQILLPVRLCPGLLSDTCRWCPVDVQSDSDCGQCPDQVMVHSATNNNDGGILLGYVCGICIPRGQSTKEPEATGRVSDIPVLLCHLLARDFTFHCVGSD